MLMQLHVALDRTRAPDSSARGDSVEFEPVARVAVGAAAVDVLVADLSTVAEDVHERHPVAAAQAEVVAEPLQDRWPSRPGR